MPNYNIAVEIDPSGAIRGRRQVNSELGAVENAANRTRESLKRAFSAAVIGAGITQSIKLASDFGDAMAEVSTLVDTARFDMEGLTQSALDQAKAFGSIPAEQAAAQYQIISAGATTAAAATDTLTVANKLAVGGVTDVATAAGGLSSVMNAYGDQVENAEAVSDALFIAMKGGQTTIAELTGGLGKVAPLAASSGVSFDELAASVSALTKGGISTQESITGVRAILAAVVKPTEEAKDLAAQLGIEFNAAGLEAQGFAGFLQQVVEKTGGSSDTLAQLFGGVEALTPALALAGTAGESFSAILEDMRAKTGATDEAFTKISESSGFQFRVLMASITVEAIRLGTILLQTIGPALQFVNKNFDAIVFVLGTGAAAFAAYKGAIILTTLAKTALSGQMGVILALTASTTRQFGVAAGAQVLYAGATTTATTAVRLFTASLIASPLAPLAAALTIAGAAYIYFTGTTDAATNATLAKEEADRIALEAESDRLALVQQFTQASEAERQALIQSAQASVAKANTAIASARADIEAARAALQRAQAERELASELSRKPGQGFSSIGAPGLGREVVAINAESQAERNLASRQAEADKAEARAAERVKDLKALEASLKAPANISIPSISSIGTGSTPSSSSRSPTPQVDREAEERKRQLELLDDFNKATQQEITLLGLANSERETQSALFNLENQLKRQLTTTERARVTTQLASLRALEQLEAVSDFEKELTTENDLLRLNSKERETRAELLRLEASLGRDLSPIEQERAENLLAENRGLREQNDLISNLNSRRDDAIERLRIINDLEQNGRLNSGQADEARQDIGLNQDLGQLDNDLFGNEVTDELLAIQELENERRRIIRDSLEAGLLDKEGFAAREIALREATARRIDNIDRQSRSLALQGAQSTADSLAGIAEGLSGKQSAAYKALFAVSKAFAIADSIIKIQQGVANALSLPFPANIGAAAVVAAEAASIISNIQSVSLAFADGGFVSGPGTGRSDSIPARLSNGEFVVNADATRRNRAALEAINSGRTVSGGSGGSTSSGTGTTIQQYFQIDVNAQGATDPEEVASRTAEAVGEVARSVAREEIDTSQRAGGSLNKRGVMVS